MVQMDRWGRQALKDRKGVMARPAQPDLRGPRVQLVPKDRSDQKDRRVLREPMDR